MKKDSDDPLNAIHAIGSVYQCNECGKEHEYIRPAKDHAQSHNLEATTHPLYEVVARE